MGTCAALFYNADINECQLAPPICEHNCTNYEGSYECSCNVGYELDDDMRTCNGKIVHAYSYIYMHACIHT